MSAPGAAAFCARLLRRQLVLAFRRPVEIGNPLLFFAMVVALFPLGLGPASDRLAEFAPGILWIIALLSNLLTSDAVFRSDFEDGSLEQLLLAPQPLYLSRADTAFAAAEAAPSTPVLPGEVELSVNVAIQYEIA